jgi:hypothetical protein
MAEYLITCVRVSARTTAGHKHTASVGVGSLPKTGAAI